ncbi:hypothetical protein U9M48_029401 [Paspalum notatum var. saurae]|uniref:Uncharacterized protein n=1 Tax=Paspalum notatum var. saurae TaxID=547442 RepID=A0AAQ3TZE8_PASNO
MAWAAADLRSRRWERRRPSSPRAGGSPACPPRRRRQREPRRPLPEQLLPTCCSAAAASFLHAIGCHRTGSAPPSTDPAPSDARADPALLATRCRMEPLQSWRGAHSAAPSEDGPGRWSLPPRVPRGGERRMARSAVRR